MASVSSNSLPTATSALSNPYHHSHQWRQDPAQRDIFYRKLGDNERTYITIANLGQAINREPWQIHVRATIALQAKDTVQVLRQAWKAMRLRFPGLVTTPDMDNDRMVYRALASAADLEAWANKTFIIEAAVAKADCFNAEAILPIPVLHVFPAARGHVEIAIRANHWRTDGIGILHLLNHFVKYVSDHVNYCVASKHEVGNAVERVFLPTPVESQYGAPTVPPDRVVRAVDAEFRDVIKNLPGAGFPVEPDLVPGAVLVRGLELSEGATKALLDACKARDLNVNAAIHAALAAVMYAYAPESRRNRPYITPTPVDLRKYTPDPSNVSVSNSGVQIVAPAEHLRDFSKAALLFKDWYNRSLTTEWLQECAYRAVVFKQLLTTPPPPDMPPGTHFMMNGLGIVESYLQPEQPGVSVQKIALGVDVLTPETVFYARTFRKKLSLEACFNEAFYKPEKMLEYIEDIVQLLEKELKITLTRAQG